jgi:hypothetical protein
LRIKEQDNTPKELGAYEPSRKYSTPNQMELEALEDRNCDGRMVLFKI